MHNTKIYILHSLGDEIKENVVSGASSTHGKERKLYRVMMGKPEGMRLLGRRGYRKEDNIKKDLKGIGWEGSDWIHLALDKDKCKHSNESSVTQNTHITGPDKERLASQDGINQGPVLVLLVQTTDILILITLDTFIEVIFPKKY